MKNVVNIVLALALVLIGALLFFSVKEEVQFDSEFKARKTAVIKRLELLRDVQKNYKSVHNKFAGSFDDITKFVEQDSFVVLALDPIGFNQENEPIYDTTKTYVAVKDSLKLPVEVNELRFIPLPKGNLNELSIEASKIKKGSFFTDVYQITAMHKDFLYDFSESKYGKSDDFHIGSLTQATDAGNW